jgi:DNA-binding transcriptional MerR regulator
VNDYGKPQNDAAQQDERARELIEQLEAIDRRITPEHVAQRFRELLDGIADNGLAASLSTATDDGMTVRRSGTAGVRRAKAVHSTGTAGGTSSGGTLVVDDPGSLQGSQGALFEADQVPRIPKVSHEPDAESAEIGYRGPAACAAAGITYRQLDYWARTGLVEPSVRAAHGSGSQRLYSFSDILVLKVVKRLLDTGISLQQIRAAVQHLRDRGTEDLTRVTLMSDGVSVYECTSADEVVDLLQGGQGVFGIALGRVWREVEGDLAVLPAVRAEDGFVVETAQFTATVQDDLALSRRSPRRACRS